MKRKTLFLIMLFAVMAANAQQNGFVCTGDYVNVRTGPGKNYAVYDSNTDHKRQLSKGDVVEYCGKRKNGFILIRQLGWGEDERDGWVSAQYLRPVTLCPQCDGMKDENIGEIDIELITCRKCKGKGYVK